MKLQKAAVLSVAVVAAMGIGAGTSYANSAPPQGDATVGYQTSVQPGGRSVATVLDSGAFRLASGGTAVDIVDNGGAQLVRIPLAYGIDGALVPISAAIGGDGRSLTLTPQMPDPAVLGVHPVYSETAYQNMVTQIEWGWLHGGQVNANIGAAIGAVVGCVLFLFVGCIPGAAIGATIGAVTGVVNANPAAQPAVFDFLRTLP
ncbi:hypothetical protein [Rhodococcus sp. NPDC127528]|uniref:hypothetical protein n=1 Tax=unclassified Rhodococcus (in: high G+C Gram-positive bacteria) TaxID=192944 RepID=UPI00363060E7